MANWPEGRVLLTWLPGAEIAGIPVTAAHCFFFHDDGVLIVQHQERGWCIPGGHLEANELPESALRRELLEEACVTPEALELLGGMRVDHTRNPRFREGGRYPKVAQQLMYAAAADALLPFRSQYEILARRLIPTADLPGVHHEWNPVLQASLDAAVRAAARGLTRGS